MESQFDMKITKLKHRNGYALIEVIVVLIISLWSIILIVPTKIVFDNHVIDSQIFTSMMKAIHTNTMQPITVNGLEINSYHPNHAFSKSYTYKTKSLDITFFIGRGYYAIEKRP